MENLNGFTNFMCQKILPTVYDDSLSYYEVLAKLSNYVNEMIVSVNNVIIAHNTLSNNYTETLKQLDLLKKEIELMKTGFYIQDGSIELKKLSASCLAKIQEYVVDTVHNIAKFVWFGLSDDGYFIAIIPESWNEIVFSTSADGELVLEY